jgi:hypothetical protein
MRDDLDRQVEELNLADERRLAESVNRLRSDDHLRNSLSAYSAQLGIGLDGPFGPSIGLELGGIDVDPEGAEAFISVLSWHPAFSEDRRLDIAIPIVGPADDDPALFRVRREASDLLLLGVLAIGTLGLGERWTDGLVQVAMGPEAFSDVIRRVLTGRPIPDPDTWGIVPDWLIKVMEEIDRRTCVLGIQHALTEVGLAAQGTMPHAFATGITSLAPNSGCDGQRVTISGSGFGSSQPQDVDVYFPTRSGSCAPAQVISWSATVIEVTAPQGVGSGCVGFVRRPSGGSGNLAEATATLAGEMERCIGMAASAAAQKLRQVSLRGIVSCPPCLPGNVNRFTGGGPVIDYFAVNSAGEVSVEPNTTLSLQWGVRNATTVSIARTSAAGPFTPPPSPLPATGTHTLGIFAGASPATATYRLTASNGCGSVTRTVSAHLRKIPKLAITGIEVVQAIQRANNSVRLVQNKATAVRVYVDSGMTGGFDYGRGPDILPDVTGTITVFPVGAGQGFGLGSPWSPGSVDARPAATINRNVQTHSLNFDLPASLAAGAVNIQARVAVKGHEKDVGGPYVAFGSTTVAFQQQPAQEILPFLIADPLWGLPTPTVAQFFTSARGSISRYPIADAGFIVNPPIPYSTTSFGRVRDLTSAIDWGFLLTELATMIFLFPTTPVGGIRAGVVPLDPGTLTLPDGTATQYALNGMAVPRIALSIPSQLSQATLQGTFAHEMGHAFGIGHAPCPPPCPGCDCTPPPGIDSRLPGATDDTAMDVASKAVIGVGRGELMSYCGDTSQCPGPTRWPSIATWDILFGSLPI